MSFFIAKLENDEKIKAFFSETLDRKNQALIDVEVQLKNTKEGVLWVNVTSIKLPPIYYLALVFLAGYFIFGGWGWFIPLSFFALSYIVFWRGFHIWAFKRGLKKAGYKGSVRILEDERGILEAFF